MKQGCLPSYIAGSRLLPEASAPRLRSLDGEHELSVLETSQVQLRRALRYADECQARLLTTPLAERIEAARLVTREYARRADEVCWALAHFRGLTCSDARWMCEVNVRWAEQFDTLSGVMFGGTGHVRGAGELSWRSKGKACLFSSSTMDGPAAVVALCHAMLSGTHLIMKPSYRDAATHLAFDTLLEHGLGHYAQLVRWPSEHPEAPQLNRQILSNVAQSVIFSANETYLELLNGAAEPGSDAWEALHQRSKRYGTGLPLALVSAQADLERAARDLVEGARLGGGRFCLSTCPVLVERSCHDALLERVVEHARKLRRGSPLAEATQLSSHDPALAGGLRAALRGFGGRLAHGEIRDGDMDVMVLADVPESSPALHRELPGPVLALIPVHDLTQAAAVATTSLRRNQRDAWTAMVMFAAEAECRELERVVPSFRYLHGGVVAQVKLLLPHQGSYFALDLMRRVSFE